jgi:hypothetical protein
MPQAITALNITNTETGKFASNLGTAHEFLVTGILMRLGFDVSVSSVKGGPYDLLVTVFENGPGSDSEIIRAAVRTANKQGSIRFTAGIRGGVNRKYIPDKKKYKYTEEHNDLVIGVDRDTLDLYLIPTVFLDYFGQSKSVNLLLPLRNNWDILLNWNETFTSNLAGQMGFTSS